MQTLDYATESTARLRRKLAFWRAWALLATITAIFCGAAYVTYAWEVIRAETIGGTYTQRTFSQFPPNTPTPTRTPTAAQR